MASGTQSKLDLLKRSPSVQQLREEIRKQFHNKLKTARNNEQCRRRTLYADIVLEIQQYFAQMDENLLEGCDSNILNVEEILKISGEIEQELINEELEIQAEQYAQEQEETLNAILNEFVVTCTICNKSGVAQSTSKNSYICDECLRINFSTENL